MATFLRLSGEYEKDGFTPVDNIFLTKYLPSADGVDVKIYLYALSNAAFFAEDFSPEKMAVDLRISVERLLEGFMFWEKKGLIAVSKTPQLSVSFLSVKRPLSPVVRYSAEKYTLLTEEISRLFPNRVIMPNEYTAIYELMETRKIGLNSMLLIIQYCIGLKKDSVGYILTVAESWADKGITKEKDVTEYIKDLENNSEQIRTVFKTLGIKRAADLDDRQYFIKWTTDFGFSFETVILAAKSLKKWGGMDALNGRMLLLKENGAVAENAAAKFLAELDRMHALAKELSVKLGLNYGNDENLIDTYVRPWLNMGFEDGTLIKLAHFCFIRSERSFASLHQMVQKFYREGILTEQAVDAYVEKQVLAGEKMSEFLSRCKADRMADNNAREKYLTWVEWGFGEEIINHIAENCQGKDYPVQYATRILAALRAKGIFDVEGAKNELLASQNNVSAPKSKSADNENYAKHRYTEEQLKGVVWNIDDWK